MGIEKMSDRELYNYYLKQLQGFTISDENLARMARGEIPYPDGFPTGYPCIDKVWLKNYENAFLKTSLENKTIYEYMYDKSSKYIDNTAVSYFGNEISYGELYDKIDMASKGLASIGVSDNDRVMYLIPNIPEGVYTLYGTSNLGAVSDYIDPRPDSLDPIISSKKVLKLFMAEKCKYIVTLDQCYLSMIKPIENELKELGVEQIVLVSATDSMNLRALFGYIDSEIKMNGIKKFVKKFKANQEMNEVVKSALNKSSIELIPYSDLISNSKYQTYKKVGYQPNKNAIITHTSGTSSSIPKPIAATHDNMNAFTDQSFGAKMGFAPGDRVMHVLPYFASFGVTDIVHTGLSHATTLVEIPEIEIENFGKCMYFNKTAINIGLPCWYVAMTEDKTLNRKDMSFVKYMTYGGTSMEISDERKVNEFNKKHGIEVNLSKGHGLSETEGCASNATGDFNVEGSIGIPLPRTVYCVVDPDTKIPLNFKTRDYIHGEFAIKSDAVCSCQLDGVSYAKHINIFGDDYLLTGDLGVMYKDGTMFFDSRMDRGFARYDGFNVKPAEIEKIIKQDPRVRYCVLVPYFDQEKLGNMIKVNLVLNESNELSEEEQINIVYEIVDNCFLKNPNVSTRQIPSKFQFRREIPLTANNKEDYKLLQNEGLSGEEVTVIFDESNISINQIEVVAPKNTLKRTLRMK